MGKAGKSILWFLGACMAFTQGVIATTAGLSESAFADKILFFGFMCLTVVLVALVSMFIKNPAFITAEKGNLVPLELIQNIAKNNDPTLLRLLLENIPLSAWLEGEQAAVDDKDANEEESLPDTAEVDEDEIGSPEDTDEFENSLQELESVSNMGER